MKHEALLEMAITAAINAGEEILRIYETDFRVEIKQDNTPVTKADKAASKSIIQDLSESNIPVLSEEDEHFIFEKRKDWPQIWIVDPLDGTKEFVKRNGEFTVNIALVEDHQPVIGIIYSPVFRHLYFACSGKGSFKVNAHDVLAEINKGKVIASDLIPKGKRLPSSVGSRPYTIVASRSHLSKEVSARVARAKLHHSKVDIINTGSSIKFCLVAEGLADEYPRYGATMEWDTAAGQCIVEEAGGSVIDVASKKRMQYNRENLLNGDFIVFRNLLENEL